VLADDAFKTFAKHRLGNNQDMYETWHKSMLHSIDSMGGTFENTDMTTGAISRIIRRPLGLAAQSFLADPFTSLKQCASVANYGGFFGWDVYKEGAASRLSDTEMQKFINAGWGVIRNRNSEFASGALSNVLDDFGGVRGTTAITGVRGPMQGIADLRHKAMGLTRKVDQKAVEVAVKMAKIKIDKTWTGPKDESYYQAVGRLADEAVISTQVAKTDISRTNLQRQKSGLVSALTFMRGARSISGSNIVGAAERYFNARQHLNQVRLNKGNIEEAQKMVADASENFRRQFVFHGLLQSAILQGVQYGKWGAIALIANAMYGTTDDDDEKRNALLEFGSSMTKNIAGLVPGGDIAVSWTEAFVQGPQEQRRMMNRLSNDMNPVAGLIEDFGGSAIDFRRWREMDRQVATGLKNDGTRMSSRESRKMMESMEELESKGMLDFFEAIGTWIGIGPLRTVVQGTKNVRRLKPDID
jgi:hypothetical protein